MIGDGSDRSIYHIISHHISRPLLTAYLSSGAPPSAGGFEYWPVEFLVLIYMPGTSRSQDTKVAKWGTRRGRGRPKLIERLQGSSRLGEAVQGSSMPGEEVQGSSMLGEGVQGSSTLSEGVQGGSSPGEGVQRTPQLRDDIPALRRSTRKARHGYGRY